MNKIEQILEKIDLRQPDTVQAALAEAMNDNNVSVGTTVAVVGDPTYPYDGLKGKVKSINGGFAEVEFDNKTTAPLHINLLVPV
jgi:hypothetical protein